MALYNLSNLPFLRIKYTLQANREGSSQPQTYKSIMKNVSFFLFSKDKTNDAFDPGVCESVSLLVKSQQLQTTTNTRVSRYEQVSAVRFHPDL